MNIKHIIDNNKLIIRLYELNKEICIIIGIIDNTDMSCQLNFIRTKTDYQNKGYALKTMNYFIKLCKEIQLNKITLDDCSDRYKKSNNLYYNCGFKYLYDEGPEMVLNI